MASTVIACVFISIGAAIDFRGCRLNEMPQIKVSTILSTMGVVLFTFGGHSALPTVQHDMRKPNDFTKSSILAFLSGFCFYCHKLLGETYMYKSSRK